MKRYVLMIIAAAAAVALLLTGCGKTGGTPEPSTDVESTAEALTEASTFAEPETESAATTAAQTTSVTTTEAASAVTTTAVTTTAEATTAETTTEQPTLPTTTEAPAAQVAEFHDYDTNTTINGVNVQLYGKWADYYPSLGAESSLEHAPSCHFDGQDNIYAYNGFTIYTFMLRGEEYVYEVDIDTASIATSKGVGVGSTANEIIAAYGTPAEQTDYRISYRDGEFSMDYIMNGGAAAQVVLYAD